MEDNLSQTLSASPGKQLWQLVQTDLPDTIVANVLMPISAGYDSTNAMNTAPAMANLTVILLTSKAEYDNLLMNFCQDTIDSVAKSFRVEELSVKLQDLLTRQQARKTYEQHAGQTDSAHPVERLQDSWLRQVYKLLDKHLDDPSLNVKWLASQLSMSRKTLLRKVQSLTQLSPNELIRQYRLRKASALLRAGHNVSETAYLVGFETPAYFGHCFKEYYQITPGEFAHSAS